MIDIKNKNIILAKESYQLTGLLFEVYNELGPMGYNEEKHFQRAVELKLKKNNIPFVGQAEIKIPYEGDEIGKFFADLIVGEGENRIILELKKSKYIQVDDIRQILRYLKATGIKLGIIANFGKRKGLQYKRIINIKEEKYS